ncbi:hypothetical protein [Sphingobium cupriresistens]|uniref:Uncharacterized protein n=1 Tax=Sphingobium cupriresistens LL01 TaxID=1420583 RepID=A0A0J7XSN7_9SPHN|nr:hypothetical protein [Sphingobium cupriresistens]KMS54692.1 hypothetical protein V473_15145 [Sphingobium cupriresistens LL01]
MTVMSLGLAGCDGAGMPSCDSVEEDVIRLEEGALIKIVKAREVSRTSREVVCRGVAVYRDGDEIKMRYRAYIDEDRDLMIAYDTDEAQQEAIDRVEAEAEEAGRKAAQEFEREMDQSMREAIGSDRWEAAKPDPDGYGF